MFGSKRGSPRRIVLRHLGLLLGMDANPVIGQVKRAAYVFRQVTSDAAGFPIHRAQTRMLRYACAMASQARLFASGDHHGTGRIRVGVVTVCASDLTLALTPALAVFQSRDLIGNQQVDWQGVFHGAGACMTLRAGPHALGGRQFVGVHYAQISRVRTERG